MTQPLQPEQNRNWKSIDIFLFSNGQQYSPPRKYHLHVEDLNWWDATLNYLARSQYGSMHSAIHLYTTDGRKIQAPIELSNGVAYVAVEPPDSFIPVGYDKYLVKASRSWEKRQAKKSNSIELSKPDLTIVKNQQSKSDMNVITRNQNATLGMDTASIGKNHTGVRMKSQSIVNSQPYLRRNVGSTLRQTDKRKNSLNPQNPTSRKSTKPLTSLPSYIKKEPVKRESLPMSKPNIFTIMPEKNVNAKPIRNSVLSTTRNKTITKNNNNKIQKTVPLYTTISTTLEISKDKKVSSSINTTSLNHKSQITDSSQMDNIIEDKELITVPYLYNNLGHNINSKTADIDRSPSLLHQTAREQYVLPVEIYVSKLDIEKETSEIRNQIRDDIVSQIVENIFMRDTILKSDPPSEKTSNTRISEINSTLADNETITKKTTEEQYIAVINKGDIVNFKLNLELRNGEGIISSKHDKMNKIQSFTNISKADKASQANIDIGYSQTSIHKSDHECKQNKSLHSVLDNENFQNACCERNTNIMIVKCACCDHTCKSDTECSIRENKKYILVLPPDCADRCKCREGTNKFETDVQKTENPEIPINKTPSITSLPKVDKKTEIIIIKGPLSIVNSNFLKGEYQNEYETNEYVMIKHRVSPSEEESQKPEYIITKLTPSQIPVSEDTQKTDFIAIRKNQLRSVTKSVTDKYTQTEWCTILLEVRLQEDGHYTFHLPPLQLIKFHKL